MENGYLDVRHLVVTILFGLITGGGIFLLPKLWRLEADIQKEEATKRWWPFSEALREGFIRSLPAAIITCTLLELAGIASFFEKLLTGDGRRIAEGFALGFGLPAIAMMLVELCVTLFNRPQFVVPPAARDEPGAVALWRSGRKHKPKK